jgi:uncharacterized protein (TIGR03663 family)
MVAESPRRLRWRGQQIVAWLLLVVVAVTLHIWGLGERTFHHDESIHAHASYELLNNGRYRYDPTYHGPLLYYLTTASFALLNDSDFSARLPIAIAGIMMIAVAWSLRRPFGERAAWWTGLLFTISPTCLYYGRFLRMDILEMVCASAACVAVYRACHGRPMAWLWAGLWAGLAVATKENCYVTAAIVGLVWGMMVSWTLLRPQLPFLMHRRESTNGLSTVGEESEQATESGLPFDPIGAIKELVASHRDWLWRHRYGLVGASAVTFLVVTPLYTVGFRYPEDWLFPVKAISYWWGQHSVQRVAGPPWFHLPRLAQYELLPIILALVWVWRRRWRLRQVEVALALFGLVSIAMYCYLGEKVPWLGVHQVWAFLPLAGAQLARTFGPRGRWWSRMVAGLGVALTAVVCVVACFVTDEISPRLSRVESLVFVQTSPELLPVVKGGRQLAEQGERPIASVSSEAGWPLTWYWRDLPVWWSEPRAGSQPPLVICDPLDELEVRKTIGPGYSREVIPLRSWWVPNRLATPRELLRYLLTRAPWGSIGSTDVVVLRRTSEPSMLVREIEAPAVLRDELGVIKAQVIGEGRLFEPRGISAHDRRLAIADTGLSQVILINHDGTVLTAPPDEYLTQPEDVAWTGEGDLLIADTWGHRVMRVSPDLAETRILPPPPGGWYGPRSLAVAEDGRLVVSDTGNKRLIVYSARGELQAIVGEAGNRSGELIEPGGVTWVGDKILVCDTGNRRLQLLTIDGSGHALPLLDAWNDFYSRPQVVRLAPDLWIASDTPAGGLWLIESGDGRLVPLRDHGLTPTGLAWSSPWLYVGDMGGRVWELELAPEWLQSHGIPVSQEEKDE